MNAEELAIILEKHQKWLIGDPRGERADLQGANLERANLQLADLRGADLQLANLQLADLDGANLRGADLRGADLREADLREADLQLANLDGANLREASLQGADLDFSCLPLWCGSLGMQCDSRFAAQLAYHFCRIKFPDDIKPYQDALAELAKQFHRFDECGGWKK